MGYSIAYLPDSQVVKIDETYTDGAIFQLQRSIDNGQVIPEKYDHASVIYDCDKSIPYEENNPDHYPLKVFGKGQQLFISGVSAGYGGEGPHGTLKCLEMLGFKLTEDEEKLILTKKRNIYGEEIPKVNVVFNK